MKRILGWSVLVLASYVLFASTCALAQIGDTGQIQGTVTDTSGAVVPRAKVTATAVATNRTSTAVTNNDGFYAFSSLRVGQYMAGNKFSRMAHN